MKRIGKVIFGIILSFIMAQSIFAVTLLGDVDGNGIITAKDKMMLARFVNGWKGYIINKDAGNINRDDDVNELDVELFNQYFAGGGQNYNIGENCEIIDRVPTDFKMDLSNATITKYIEGQTITDFTGITLTIFFDNEMDCLKYAGNEINELNIKMGSFVYGRKTIDVDLFINNVRMTSALDVSEFTIAKRQIISITESSVSAMNKVYIEGEKLNFDGLIFVLTYNSGETEEISYANPNLKYSPQNGTVLDTKNDKVLVVYEDSITGNAYSSTIPLKVTAKPVESKTIKDIKLLSSASAKREYFIGDSFDPEGFAFLLVYSDGTSEVKDLYTFRSDLTVDSNKYDNSKEQFTAAMDGDLKVEFNITYNNESYSVTLTIPGIIVTKRPVLTSIIASSSKLSYREGETPQVKDFVITAKYDDNSQRVFMADENDIGAQLTTYSITQNNVTYTITVTPSVIAFDTNTIRVTYSETIYNGTTVTKYDDVEIENVSVTYTQFEKTPYVIAVGTIECKPLMDGTVYFYYLKNDIAPSVSIFPDLWNIAENSDCVSVVGNTVCQISYDAMYAANHSYMVLCLRDSNGNYRAPVVIRLVAAE